MTVESQEMGAVQRRERFIQGRFGLFIEWGIYALAARHGGNGLAEWSMPNCFMMVLRYICRAMGTMIHSRLPYLFSALMCSCLFWSYFSGRAHGLKENLPL